MLAKRRVQFEPVTGCLQQQCSTNVEAVRTHTEGKIDEIKTNAKAKSQGKVAGDWREEGLPD